jgi:hypothetical protein
MPSTWCYVAATMCTHNHSIQACNQQSQSTVVEATTSSERQLSPCTQQPVCLTISCALSCIAYCPSTTAHTVHAPCDAAAAHGKCMQHKARHTSFPAFNSHLPHLATGNKQSCMNDQQRQPIDMRRVRGRRHGKQLQQPLLALFAASNVPQSMFWYSCTHCSSSQVLQLTHHMKRTTHSPEKPCSGRLKQQWAAAVNATNCNNHSS